MAGPSSQSSLTRFRKLASFDWKNMKLYFDGEEVLTGKEKIYQELYKTCLNNHSSKEGLDELRRYINDIHKKFSVLYYNMIRQYETNYAISLPLALFIGHFTPEIPYKEALSKLISITILKSIGTNTEDAISNLSSGKWVSCISLTELAHGSNLMKLQTTATYNAETKTFILHSPTVEAWKCWAGNLGFHATHALVLAQLYTDGKWRGINWFFTPIRDPLTRKSYPGVLVGDMGIKIGFNGLDNGFLAFNSYHIPKTSLLNGVNDVTDDGQFITYVKNQRKSFALAASNLNISRLAIITVSIGNHIESTSITIRYAFAVSKPEKAQILDSPIQQRRLFSYLSSAYVFNFVLKWMLEKFTTYQAKVFDGICNEALNSESKDYHILISGMKAIMSWESYKCTKEAIEFCGCHGYLEDANLGHLRNNQDANLTLEGDNNVLLQQISKTLLSVKGKDSIGKPNSTIGLFDFVEEIDTTINRKSSSNSIQMTPEGIKDASNWLLCYLLNECYSKMTLTMINGARSFDAFNSIQTYDCNTLATVFTENFIISQYFEILNESKPPKDCAPCLMNLGLLYGFCYLEKHLLTLCTGGYFSSWDAMDKIQSDILYLCNKIKDDSLALADVIAPPDVMMQSFLGKSDGEVYNRMKTLLMNNLQQPKQWLKIREETNSKL